MVYMHEKERLKDRVYEGVYECVCGGGGVYLPLLGG